MNLSRNFDGYAVRIANMWSTSTNSNRIVKRKNFTTVSYMEVNITVKGANMKFEVHQESVGYSL